VVPGTFHRGARCEDLAALTFEDCSLDLHVTQDVMEHVLQPAEAFREIARTLRPGGAHIFTVPLVRRNQPSVPRAVLVADGTVAHLLPPEYHGNPIDPDGSLVTRDWGFDIAKQIFDASGMFTHIVVIDDLSRGIRAELIEVCVSIKPPLTTSAPEPTLASDH
jgi:SAM-dependent methyltransferase